jgi:hypothetical protein
MLSIGIFFGSVGDEPAAHRASGNVTCDAGDVVADEGLEGLLGVGRQGRERAVTRVDVRSQSKFAVATRR